MKKIFVISLLMSNIVFAANVVNINNAVAKANVSMSGNINAKNGKFFGNVVIASDRATLNHSEINGSLTIKSKAKTPVIELICGTKISGEIIFQGKSGVVKKSADSVAGKITNGKIEKFEFDKC